ncbi:MAG TPA: cytochrome c biogenesis protein CcsA [Capsulimonadaceae bacterium]|jgi:ABC-type uncharacterized transport system permease subunit
MNGGLETIMAAIGYLLAAVFYGKLVIEAPSANRAAWQTTARVCGLVGVFLHTSAIGISCVQNHHTPFATPVDLIAATGWSLALAYLVVEAFMRERPPLALGSLAFGLSFLSVFTGSVIHASLPHRPEASMGMDSAVISLHVMAFLFSFALLFLAVGCALIYLFEHRLLKQKKVVGGLFSRLPPLSTLDGLSFSLVSLAFPLLTIGLAAGIITAVSRQLPIADMHTALSVLTWLSLGVYLYVHATAMERGIRANYILIVCLVLAVMTHFTQNMVHHLV